MKRLEIILELEKLESRKINFQNLLNDVNDRFSNNTIMWTSIDSSSWNKKYQGEKIEVNRNLFADYLEREIKAIEGKINELIDKLK